MCHACPRPNFYLTFHFRKYNTCILKIYLNVLEKYAFLIVCLKVISLQHWMESTHPYGHIHLQEGSSDVSAESHFIRHTTL